MADDDNNDLERVATPDNTHPAPGNREEAVPDPPATSRDPQSKNEVRIKVFLLDGKDTTITCEVPSVCVCVCVCVRERERERDRERERERMWGRAL